MSHTVSRGTHTVSRWSAPAIAVLEQLERGPGAPAEPFGAFVAIQSCFSWMLEGVAQTRGEALSRNVPPARGSIALGYAVGILKTVGHKDPDEDLVYEYALQCSDLVRRIQYSGKILGSQKEIERLKRILKELASPSY